MQLQNNLFGTLISLDEKKLSQLFPLYIDTAKDPGGGGGSCGGQGGGCGGCSSGCSGGNGGSGGSGGGGGGGGTTK